MRKAKDVGNRKAQAGANTNLFGREKWLKDLRAQMQGYARPSILHQKAEGSGDS